MDTNMRSTFLFTSATVLIMKEQRQRRRLILQISSQAGLRGFSREAIYCASKYAQIDFTDALRRELQPFDMVQRTLDVACQLGHPTGTTLVHLRNTVRDHMRHFPTPSRSSTSIAALEASHCVERFRNVGRTSIIAKINY